MCDQKSSLKRIDTEPQSERDLRIVKEPGSEITLQTDGVFEAREIGLME